MNNQRNVTSSANCSSWTEFLGSLRALLPAREPAVLRSALNRKAAQIFSSSDLLSYIQRNHDWLENSPKLQIVSGETHSKRNELRPLFDSILKDDGPDAAAVFLLDYYCSGSTVVINHHQRRGYFKLIELTDRYLTNPGLWDGLAGIGLALLFDEQPGVCQAIITAGLSEDLRS
jgi:hypothetical protein